MANSRKKNIPKNIVIVFVSLILIVILFSIFSRPKNVKYPDGIGLTIKNQDYYLEVAHTNETRAKGLSNREKICPNCGMIFVFDKPAQYTFWMKDTLIPLDMVWLDDQGKIVKIATVLDINNDQKKYTNDQNAKYVIELNANEAFKLDLKIGDTIDLSGLKNE